MIKGKFWSWVFILLGWGGGGGGCCELLKDDLLVIICICDIYEPLSYIVVVFMH